MNNDLQFSCDCVKLFRVKETAYCAVNYLFCLSMKWQWLGDLRWFPIGSDHSSHQTVGVANDLGGSYHIKVVVWILT